MAGRVRVNITVHIGLRDVLVHPNCGVLLAQGYMVPCLSELNRGPNSKQGSHKNENNDSRFHGPGDGP
jgi:hypothetical protein